MALLPSPPSPVACSVWFSSSIAFHRNWHGGPFCWGLISFSPLSCWACSTIKALPNRSRRCDRIDQFQVQCMGSHVLHHRIATAVIFILYLVASSGTEVPRSSLDSSSRFSSFYLPSNRIPRFADRGSHQPGLRRRRRGRRGRRIERSSLRMSAETRSSNTPTIECSFFYLSSAFSIARIHARSAAMR